MIDIIFLLIINIIPLYVLIALGFFGGRYMDLNLHSVAKILIFFLSPIVTFGAILNIDFNISYILLPLILFAFSTIISVSAYTISKIFWKDGNANLIGAGSVNGNTLYFGVPIVSALLGPTGLGIWILMNLGPSLNNFTLAYYYTARGNFSVRESLLKVIKLPALHGALLAIIFNIFDYEMPTIMTAYWEYSTGAFVILGMMLIGIALSKQNKFAIDLKLLSAFFFSKFFIWPVVIFAFILLDKWILNLYGNDIHLLLALFSAMPLIGNLVAYAAENDLHPERAASAVLISSLFSFIAIPAAYLLYHALP